MSLTLLVEKEHHDNYPANLSWVSFLKYYAKRYEVATPYVLNRQFIYSFKEGNHIPAIDNLFIQEINKRKLANPAMNFWFCAIPASKAQKTQMRFQQFCQRISAVTKINNGYTMLQNKEDRAEIHIGGSRDYSKVISSIAFNQISGKNILLCDDVATLGRSFRVVSAHLMQLGAKSVFGIMLAKTHWLEEDNAFTI
jgi:predicted amidophosphoribosyltransferase